MQNKLFVGGLPWAVDNQRLEEVFSEYGEVTSARVVTDRETRRSRGFGFVEFADEAAAAAALEAMNDADLDGRTLKVDFAEDKQ